MSKEINNIPVDDMINSYLHSITNVKCKTHQVLNKYYLKYKNIFVCEYCGFDNDGPDSFMHMPQILEKYHDEIINLQFHPEYFKPNEFFNDLQKHLKSSKKFNLDLSRFNYDYESFMVDLFPKMIFFIQTNYSLYEIKDLINEVKFTSERKVELFKIGNEEQKEQKLIMLAQYLVSQGGKNSQQTNYTDSFKKFLQDFQIKFVDLIFLALEFLESSYNQFLPELAKLEKRKIGEIPYLDYLKSHITNKKEKELLIQNYLQIINTKDAEIINLKESLKNERNQNVYLEHTINDLNKKLNELENSYKSKDKVNRDRIDELEYNIFILREELENGGKEKLRQKEELIKKLKLENENELNKIKAEFQEKDFNRNKEFEVKLLKLRNQNNEMENNFKSIEFLINDSVNDANIQRIKELELILNDERERNELIINEYEKKLKNLNELYINNIKDFDNHKIKFLEFEIRYIDLKNKLNLTEKENENLKKYLTDKDALIKKSIDDNNNERILEKKRFEEIQNKLNDMNLLNSRLQKELKDNENYKKYYDMYLPLRKDNDKNILDNNALMNNNQNLKSQLDFLKKDYENNLQLLERENGDLRNNNEKANSLIYNLNLQAIDKDRKIELIQKSTESLKQKIKPYPWGENESLVKNRNGNNGLSSNLS